MSIEPSLELNLKRVRKLMTDLLLSEADAARIADMSVNTVKAILTNTGGSRPSLLKLERALEMERRRRDAVVGVGRGENDLPQGFEDQLALALSISAVLSTTLHEMTKSAPPTSPPLKEKDAIVLDRHLKSATASLSILS